MDEAAALELAIDTAHEVAAGSLDAQRFVERLLRHLHSEGTGVLSVWTSLSGLAPTAGALVPTMTPPRWFTAGCDVPNPEFVQTAAPYLTNHPGFIALRRLGTSGGCRLSDEVPLRRFWGTPRWEAVHSLFDGRFPAAVVLHVDDRSLIYLGVNLKHRDFTDEEMLCLARVQQPIAAAYRYRAALDAATARIDTLYTPAENPGTGARTPSRDAPTRREAEVLALMAAGWTNTQIATRLHITERTVRKHLSAVYEKAHLPGRAAAAAWWVRHRDEDFC